MEKHINGLNILASKTLSNCVQDIFYKLNSRDYVLYLFNTVDSTNSVLKQKASSGAKDKTVVISMTQTNGRGRLGRSFFSPDRTGLYMSVLVRRDCSAEDAMKLTTIAAVAVMQTLKKYADNVKIKWVNDIYIDDKKVCGILTESSFLSNGRLDYAVVGIGINLFAPENGFPDDIKNRAGYITENYSRRLFVNIVAGILNEFELLLNQTDIAFEIYRSNSYLDGKRVCVNDNTEECYCANVKGIDEQFRLVVIKDDTSEARLFSGEVSVVPIEDSL